MTFLYCLIVWDVLQCDAPSLRQEECLYNLGLEIREEEVFENTILLIQYTCTRPREEQYRGGPHLRNSGKVARYLYLLKI